MHAHIVFEDQFNDLSDELFDNLRQPEALGPKLSFERYQEWLSQWNRPSRNFHGLSHLFAMSQLPPQLDASAAIYAMVGGFFHDDEYPTIGENITPVSKRYIDKYIEVKDGKHILKSLDANDQIGKVLYGVFGYQPGQALSPFGGMNEFYSAAAAAGEMQELGKNPKFILGVTSVIEATIPFGNPDRMDKLRERVVSVSQDLNLNLSANDVDQMMIASVYTANKDVSGFLGGLDPLNPEAKPTTQSVINTIMGGSMLNAEEIPTMRLAGKSRDTSPGDYPSDDFLAAKLKRAGLYQLVLKGNDQDRSIPNLYFETTLSGGDVYPPDRWVPKANALAYENNLPVRTAEYARLISHGIVNSIAQLAGALNDPKLVSVKDFVDGMGDRIDVKLPADVSKTRRLAYEAVSGRLPTTKQDDVTRSPLAELVIAKLDEHEIQGLALKARELLFPERKPEAFLKAANELLGDTVEKIRSELEANARATRRKAAAEGFRHVKLLPDVDLPHH